MNSDRRILGLVLVALTATACLNREGTEPPIFPAGGLLSRSVPPPLYQPAAPGATYETMVQLLQPLDGVYTATSRFGNPVVVIPTLTGNARDTIQANLGIFSSDKNAFALLQPGCLEETVNGATARVLVFEGYWRYLEYPEPTQFETGLIRLYAQPATAAAALCNGEAVAPGSVKLVGATGYGNDSPTNGVELTYTGARKSRKVDGRTSFLVGAHHGGCQSTDNCGVSENTGETFVLAKKLGGDYLELDVRLTADNVPVLYHLGLSPTATQGIYCTGGIQDWTYQQLVANCRLRNGEIIPRLVDALEYGLTRTDLLVWLDMKVTNAVVPSGQIVKELSERLVQCQPGQAVPAGKKCLFPGSRPVIERVIIGLPSDDIISEYQTALAAGQLAPGQRCLCEENFDAAVSIPCQAASPRYTRGPLASDVLNLQSMGKFFGYWTINDPVTIDAFLQAGRPNGILTNYLGTLNVRWEVAGVLPPYPLGSGL